MCVDANLMVVLDISLTECKLCSSFFLNAYRPDLPTQPRYCTCASWQISWHTFGLLFHDHHARLTSLRESALDGIDPTCLDYMGVIDSLQPTVARQEEVLQKDCAEV